MSDIDLSSIAKRRHTDPMSTWPSHDNRHLRTLLGALLFDEDCLRCHLEKEATRTAKAELGEPVE